ncbi:Ca2+ regulator and membrane fusion protein Fig1-domain-containing protein [Echria macrotheca]|uniref:Ca2+ regulator and membrane fusion protein Fig1-domain-containing protein n=1 Tax=Echria macrotheca TaxID=438768 RepID=A0AAJ0BNC5_9PEZI|nr:Ca2+ regulator and membrane fusion protein Fig1-domain-containing protein [Echria macrotheca]
MLFLLKLGKMFRKDKSGGNPGSGSSIFRLLPFVLIIPIFLFQALSLSGCTSTSPAIPSIYLVSLEPARSNLTTPTGIEIRINYFGICSDDGTTKRCISSAGGSGSTDAVTTTLFPTTPLNPNTTTTTSKNTSTAVTQSELKDLVSTALDLQSQIFISILAGSTFAFFVGLIFLFLYKRDLAKPNPSKPRRSALFRRATYGLIYLSVGLVFAAALATTETADALQFASRATDTPKILMHAGRTLQVLQWMAFGFSTLFALTVPVLVKPRAVGGVGFPKGGDV